MNPLQQLQLQQTRRHFFGKAAAGIGGVALASLLNPGLLSGTAAADQQAKVIPGEPGILAKPHHKPTAKRIIYLFMSGAPSQFETFDHKPLLADQYDKDLPASVINGQRFTTMTSRQKRFPIAPSIYRFNKYGEHGAEISELLPNMGSVADDIAIVRSMHTEAINHDPAITFIQTGGQVPGRPSLGAWLSYGLGSSNRDLPAFVVLNASWSAKRDAQALYTRLWGSGFLPSKFQGVNFRAAGDPVLYLSDPPGVNRESRREMLDALAEMNAENFNQVGDPEINNRIAQYEMAYRMQSSVPELVDFKDETKETLELYGPDVHKPGTFASCCLLARRMAERDVNFVQVFHRGWDQHGNLPRDITAQCKDIDQPSAALIKDLKQRGLLDDTLVIWGGEFGRTTYCQGGLSKTNYGRDHHPRCFSVWLAGGGVKPGIVYGATDEFSYNITENPVHIHDLNATILHTLGVDHEKLTFRYQGRDFRLTDVHGKVVKDILT